MENVPQLLGSNECIPIVNLARDMGFLVTSAKLCAADYGIPQTRWRAFIIGCRFEDTKKFFPPRKTHYDPGKGNPKSNLFNDEYIESSKPWRTVYDTISDLPAPLPASTGCRKFQKSYLNDGLFIHHNQTMIWTSTDNTTNASRKR